MAEIALNTGLSPQATGMAVSSTLVIEGELGSAGEIANTGQMAGTIRVEQGGAGNIFQFGQVTGTFTIGTSSAHGYTGPFLVLQDIEGNHPSSGTFTFENLRGSGVFDINGALSGLLEVKGEMTTNTVLHPYIVTSTGVVRVNSARRANMNANGTITVVHLTSGQANVPGCLDGTIEILDSQAGAGGTGGALNGTIDVQGCHDDGDDLDLCICGDDNGTTAIRNSGGVPRPSRPRLAA